MRTFLIFSIDDNYYSLYRNYPKSIYNLLNEVYHLKKDNLVFAKGLFEQLVNNIDKDRLDSSLFLKLHRDIPYSKRGDTHIFNNYYFGDITTMVIKSKYIKIVSSKDQNYFFRALFNYDKHFFVCDFDNCDYFFLENVLVYS